MAVTMSDIESDLESPARKKRPSAVAITPPPPSPENEIEQKRGRGRPKGSKNKKKDDSVKPSKKGPGRPQKNATPTAIEVSDNNDTQNVDMTESFTLANDDIEKLVIS